MKKLVEKNISFHFISKESYFISGNNEKMVLFCDDDLYYLSLAQSESKVFYSYTLWHSRFGHASNDKLRKMKNDNSVYGLETFSSIENRELCQPCALNKSTIENIPKASRDISKEKFDLIHSDICGPFPKFLKNQRYMVSFIDDHTKFARLYFMREKSELPEKFKEYLANVGKGNVKSLRSDNGTEYTSRAFRESCIDEGIRQEFTSPYSPFQNGVAERYWRAFCGYDWESKSYILYSIKSSSSVVVMSNLMNNNFITRCRKIPVDHLLFSL